MSIQRLKEIAEHLDNMAWDINSHTLSNYADELREIAATIDDA